MKLPRLRLRSHLSTLVEASGAADRVLRARARWSSPFLTALTYHRVRPTPDSGGFDDGVVDATTAEFEQQIELLSRSFSFVSTKDVGSWLRGGSLPKNPVLVTFDDAYRECLEVATPILRRHGARATFFVCSHHVEHRRLPWWDRAAYLIRNATVEQASVTGFDLSLDLRDEARREASRHRVLRAIKDRFGLDIEAFLLAVAEACGVEWNAALERTLADSLVATWDDVRALRDAGMDVQSHTRTHRVLQTLSPQELADELVGSRRDLEAVLGEPVRALAYPTGRPVDPAIARAVSEAGYDLAFANAGGVNLRFLRSSPFMLRRMSMSTGISAEHFATVLALPILH